MTDPSSSPRGEHTPAPGARWETTLRTTERVVADDAPDPAPPANRADRRIAARALRTRSGNSSARQLTDPANLGTANLPTVKDER